MSPGLKTSGFLSPLLALSICFALLPSLLCFTSELSMILCGIVDEPGKQGAQFRNSSASEPLLSGLCSQLRVWHTDAIPARVPSEVAMAAFTLLTACSASPFD